MKISFMFSVLHGAEHRYEWFKEEKKMVIKQEAYYFYY